MPEQAIAVLNAGSSSLKFSVYFRKPSGLRLELRGQVEALSSAPRFVARNADDVVVAEHAWPQGAVLDHEGALGYLFEFLRARGAGVQLIGVGHRVVHGGMAYAQPMQVDDALLDALEAFVPLAPLHQPHNLAAIRAMRQLVPDVAQVACFDTAFHRSNPELAQMFALPYELHESGVRRYGFHGLSYEYIAAMLPGVDPRAAQGRTIVLHLGNGASMCALQAGRSIASTMGFTALDGLPMGTRAGSLDAGVILYLQQQRGMDVRDVETLLYHQSGLLGVSGIASDMRTLLASSEPRARLAIDLYVYRIARELGSLAAALGGVDAIVFTAGIGENSAPIRERVCRAAAWMGIDVDGAANAAGGPRISTAASRIAVWAIPTNEELMIAQHTDRLLDRRAAQA